MRKKRKLKKRDCQTIHFKKRAMQRFGVHINKDTRNKIISEIQSSSDYCVFLEKQSNTRTKYLVSFPDLQPMIVIYDKSRKNLVTALNPLTKRYEK